MLRFCIPGVVFWMVFARASASCSVGQLGGCDHCRMCWDDLGGKHDLFFWGWKSSEFGHDISQDTVLGRRWGLLKHLDLELTTSRPPEKISKSPQIKAWDPYGAATVGRWKLRWVARGPGTWPELSPGEAWQSDQRDVKSFLRGEFISPYVHLCFWRKMSGWCLLMQWMTMKNLFDHSDPFRGLPQTFQCFSHERFQALATLFAAQKSVVFIWSRWFG